MGDTSLSAAVRFGPWPGDSEAAMLSQRDHTEVMTLVDLSRAVRRAHDAGYRVLRTSALLERSAAVAERAGFRVIDTLELLERDLRAPLVPTEAPGVVTPEVRPMRPWHHREAARVDRAAFGELWGMDRRGIAAIVTATPRRWARTIRADTDGAGRGPMCAFLIAGMSAGVGGHRPRVGYLQRLSVHPDHQGRGLGRLLVHRSLVWLWRRGAATAIVNTGTHNHRALDLYHRAGFERTGRQMTVWEFALDAPGEQR